MTQVNTHTDIQAIQIANQTTEQLVTMDELRDILIRRHGSAFARVVMLTSMDDKNKMRKTNNPWYGKNIRKETMATVLVNFDYDASLQRRTDGEESAKGGPTWQQAVIIDGKLTPLTVHKKDVISVDPLRINPNANCYLRCEYRSGSTRYIRPSGQVLSDAEADNIRSYQTERTPSAVKFMTVSFASVQRLTIDKITYVLDHG